MKTMALAVFTVALAAIAAEQYASYEFGGFAQSLQQAQVTGPLDCFAFPASPIPALILTPRAKQDIAANQPSDGKVGGEQEMLLRASVSSSR
jgi:hypothetical protein